MVFTAGDYKTIDFVRIGVFLQVGVLPSRNKLLLGCTAQLRRMRHLQLALPGRGTSQVGSVITRHAVRVLSEKTLAGITPSQKVAPDSVQGFCKHGSPLTLATGGLGGGGTRRHSRHTLMALPTYFEHHQ